MKGSNMTLGEKIREARKQACLSQEELAVKLGVSRQAVSKWESDKGIPDIYNLKAIAKLLSVSVDYLLDDGTDMNKVVMKESIDLAQVPKTKYFCKEDVVVMEKFPEADSIFRLMRERALKKREKVADSLIGWAVLILGDIPLFDTFVFADQLRDMSLYYLVNQRGKQFLVNVQKDYIVSEELANPIHEKKFVLGDNKFQRVFDLVERQKKWGAKK